MDGLLQPAVPAQTCGACCTGGTAIPDVTCWPGSTCCTGATLRPCSRPASCETRWTYETAAYLAMFAARVAFRLCPAPGSWPSGNPREFCCRGTCRLLPQGDVLIVIDIGKAPVPPLWVPLAPVCIQMGGLISPWVSWSVLTG